jgi:hypothetical protein
MPIEVSFAESARGVASLLTVVSSGASSPPSDEVEGLPSWKSPRMAVHPVAATAIKANTETLQKSTRVKDIRSRILGCEELRASFLRVLAQDFYGACSRTT